ncbi:MAG: hypothetical protein R6W91_06115, partial [Thermoplasmata archaeon]
IGEFKIPLARIDVNKILGSYNPSAGRASRYQIPLPLPSLMQFEQIFPPSLNTLPTFYGMKLLKALQ